MTKGLPEDTRNLRKDLFGMRRYHSQAVATLQALNAASSLDRNLLRSERPLIEAGRTDITPHRSKVVLLRQEIAKDNSAQKTKQA